jgi:prepilin-type N-terminal cleavage/methylation domain-containing protein
MRLKLEHQCLVVGHQRSASRAAFTLTESLVAIVVLGMAAVALCSGISWGVFVVSMTHDNQRATQILTERMETIRLYGWDNLNDPAFLPKTVQLVDYSSKGATSKVYTLNISVRKNVVAANYSNDLAEVRLDLTWKTGNNQRQRSLSTYVFRSGLQTYVN